MLNVGHDTSYNFTSLSPSLSRSLPTNSLDIPPRSTRSKSTTSTTERTDQWLYRLLWANNAYYLWLYDLISVASAVHIASNIVWQCMRHLQYKIWWLDCWHEHKQPTETKLSKYVRLKKVIEESNGYHSISADKLRIPATVTKIFAEFWKDSHTVKPG